MQTPQTDLASARGPDAVELPSTFDVLPSLEGVVGEEPVKDGRVDIGGDEGGLAQGWMAHGVCVCACVRVLCKLT